MPDNALVVGAGGFIGHALCAQLIATGNTVRGLCPTPPESPIAGVDYHIAKMDQRRHLDALLDDCQCVVYTAASSTPGSSAGKPLEEIDHHLRPLNLLLCALQDHPDVHLLFVSSAGATYGSRPGNPFSENDLPHPASYHGATKVAAEMYIAAWARQFGGSATIFRPSNVYGPGQRERRGFGIIPAAFGALRRNEQLDIWGDGSAVRDYLYIDDLVALMVSAIRDGGRSGIETYNAASGECISLNHLLQLIETICQRVVPKRYLSARAVDATKVRFENRKACERFHWRPAHSLYEGLQSTWAWLNQSKL